MREQLVLWFQQYFTPFSMADLVLNLVDIAVVALAIYLLLRLVRGTRAVQLIKGFIAVTLFVIITEVARLNASHWLLANVLQNWVIALIVLFQQELRLVVEQIGRGRIITEAFHTGQFGMDDAVTMINEIVRATRRLSERNIGALIAIERQVGLKDIISTGKSITGSVSAELLQTIFHPGTPMHDGGVVIQGHQLAAAMCLFPLTTRDDHPRSYGTRHRAAIGLSEVTDAVIIVVSEETGAISLALEGELIHNLSVEALKERLLALLQPVGPDAVRWFGRPSHKDTDSTIPEKIEEESQ
ncbi:MAG: diadenylate cyclase CdaA [bacterium]